MVGPTHAGVVCSIRVTNYLAFPGTTVARAGKVIVAVATTLGTGMIDGVSMYGTGIHEMIHNMDVAQMGGDSHKNSMMASLVLPEEMMGLAEQLAEVVAYVDTREITGEFMRHYPGYALRTAEWLDMRVAGLPTASRECVEGALGNRARKGDVDYVLDALAWRREDPQRAVDLGVGRGLEILLMDDIVSEVVAFAGGYRFVVGLGEVDGGFCRQGGGSWVSEPIVREYVDKLFAALPESRPRSMEDRIRETREAFFGPVLGMINAGLEDEDRHFIRTLVRDFFVDKTIDATEVWERFDEYTRILLFEDGSPEARGRWNLLTLLLDSDCTLSSIKAIRDYVGAAGWLEPILGAELTAAVVGESR